jgi:hypothetical protein
MGRAAGGGRDVAIGLACWFVWQGAVVTFIGAVIWHVGR